MITLRPYQDKGIADIRTLFTQGRKRLCRARCSRFSSAAPAAAAITGEIVPAGKPDLDNLLKSVFDGIRTIVIGDDAVIVALLPLNHRPRGAARAAPGLRDSYHARPAERRTVETHNSRSHEA
jgi:Endodeoxyribonuclease RusA